MAWLSIRNLKGTRLESMRQEILGKMFFGVFVSHNKVFLESIHNKVSSPQLGKQADSCCEYSLLSLFIQPNVGAEGLACT
jgi:hypothetical protein